MFFSGIICEKIALRVCLSLTILEKTKLKKYCSQYLHFVKAKRHYSVAIDTQKFTQSKSNEFFTIQIRILISKQGARL